MLTYLIIYAAAATMAAAVFVLAGWWSRSERSHTIRLAHPDALISLRSEVPADKALADVRASLMLALKRLIPILSSGRVRVEYAVLPGLLVRMSGIGLADVLEELMAAAIHHAQANRLVVTAEGHGEQVHISVTDDAFGEDPSLRQSVMRGMAEKIALRGGVLDVVVRPGEGTTMTLRLAAAAQLSRPEIEPEEHVEHMLSADFAHSIGGVAS